ncbi:MAG: cupin domain-containing protein [Cyanobacteriota bacterium]|nr:cupin domain-containing protein [Cyanobacteriota bacterium]
MATQSSQGAGYDQNPSSLARSMVEADAFTLSALCQLGILDSETHVEIDPEWSSAANSAMPASADSVLAAWPYQTAPLPLNPNLKERVWQQIQTGIADHREAALTSLRQAEQVWQPFQEGVEIVQLYVDEETRSISCLLKAEAGVCYPAHRNPIPEEIYMLGGDLSVNGQALAAGDYLYIPTGTVHTLTTERGCICYLHTSLDDEFLQPLVLAASH